MDVVLFLQHQDARVFPVLFLASSAGLVTFVEQLTTKAATEYVTYDWDVIARPILEIYVNVT
jgi:hypothetical protein